MDSGECHLRGDWMFLSVQEFPCSIENVAIGKKVTGGAWQHAGKPFCKLIWPAMINSNKATYEDISSFEGSSLLQNREDGKSKACDWPKIMTQTLSKNTQTMGFDLLAGRRPKRNQKLTTRQIDSTYANNATAAWFVKRYLDPPILNIKAWHMHSWVKKIVMTHILEDNTLTMLLPFAALQIFFCF